MTRLPTFDREEVGGIRGLTSLTEPADDESVGAIVDVAVIGARGDGKTQFIVHAIRTLRAYAPVLDGAEHQYNRDVLQVVMNAREPRPEATAPGVVPHYVFRIRPKSLLSQVGGMGRLSLYARVAGLWTFLTVALVNALGVGFALDQLSQISRPAIIASSVGLFALGCVVGAAFSRSRFLGRGNIEMVFWDVAGEHVYSDSAADYYSFLSALVRMRRQRTSADRAYAFAPVLICNPVALSTRAQGSSYARLRKLIPLFASLNEPLARAMVAINRWTVVKEVCAPDTDRSEIVAVVPQARQSDEDDFEILEEESIPVVHSVLPVVKRDVVRKHCLDAEDGSDNDVHFTYLRYDAGMQCEFHERPWKPWDDMDDSVRSRWRAPTVGTPSVLLDYVYEDGPGAFEGDVRRVFLEWIASLAFHEASYGKSQPRVSTSKRLFEEKRAQTEGRRERPEREAAFVEARKQKQRDTERRDVDKLRTVSDSRPYDDGHNAWRPRPLSAQGLDDFARDTIAPDDLLGDAIDASLVSAGDVSESSVDDNEQDRMAETTAFSSHSTVLANSIDAELEESPAKLTGSADATLTDDDGLPDEQALEERENDSRVEDDDEVHAGDDERLPESVDASNLVERRANSDRVQRRGKRRTNPGFGSLDDVSADDADAEEADGNATNDDAKSVRSEPEPVHSDTLRMPRGFGSGGT